MRDVFTDLESPFLDQKLPMFEIEDLEKFPVAYSEMLEQRAHLQEAPEPGCGATAPPPSAPELSCLT